MIKITIDGHTIEVEEGTTILEAATKININIPRLCYHPKITPFGGCRLCIVEIKGMPRPVTSCTTPVSNGMEVLTSTQRLERIRKTIIELLLSDHPNECMICEKAGDCELQDLAYIYGINPIYPSLLRSENEGFKGERRIYTERDNNPFIERDMGKCILCGRCVRVCEEVQGVKAIDFAYRGFKTKICPPYEEDLNCEFCGQCISVCPTGALMGKQWHGKARLKGIKTIETVCGYCGCGCNISLQVHNNEVIKVDSRQDTINEGWLCAKGRFGYSFINSPERLTMPMIRISPKRPNESFAGREAFKEASWDEALDYIAERLKAIKEDYGPDSIAGLSSARATNEENYLFQKLIRAAIGTNNIDHCARY